MTVQTLILSNLLSSQEYCRSVIPYLKPEYFEGSYRVFFDTVCKYVSKYGTLPGQSALVVELGNLSVNEDIKHELSVIIGAVFSANVANDQKWLLDQTEAWCKERALQLALLRAWDSHLGKDKTLKKDAIPSLLQDALSISFDNSIGHDYFEDAESRFENLKNKAAKVPFVMNVLNEITNGGAEYKTINCILAGTNVGKSLAMCHLASDYISQGHDVLYLTMEMADEKIAHRLDANLLNIDINSIEKHAVADLVKQLKKKRKSTFGRLIIKEFPTGTPNVNHFRAILEDLKVKKGYNPRIIFVDYINLCSSVSGESDSYGKIKRIAEQLRGWAMDKDLLLWTATQLTREGMKSSDADMTQTSESIGLPQTVDYLIAMSQDETMAAAGQYLCKQLKSRYGDVNKRLRFTIGVEKGNMRLYEVAQSSAPMTQALSPKAAPEKDEYAVFRFDV